MTTLRTQASNFGSNLSTVQTRQDFTKTMINTLQTGADSLVLADTNEEGANMLALQTRQQLPRPRCRSPPRPARRCCGCSGEKRANSE